MSEEKQTTEERKTEGVVLSEGTRQTDKHG